MAFTFITVELLQMYTLHELFNKLNKLIQKHMSLLPTVQGCLSCLCVHVIVLYVKKTGSGGVYV